MLLFRTWFAHSVLTLCFSSLCVTELRKKATQFQALAVAETIGHTLAEEALHEAEERAASCEIAEAVLISAAAGGRLLVEEKEEGGAGV